MEIQSLKLSVTEDEINLWLPRLLPPHLPVESLRVRLVPEGVVVQGEYPTMMLKMSFETLWEVTVSEGLVKARLASVKVAGLPAGLLRGVLLKTIRDATAKEPGVRVEEESVVLDVEQALRARAVPVRIRMSAVRCGLGTVTIEAGPT